MILQWPDSKGTDAAGNDKGFRIVYREGRKQIPRGGNHGPFPVHNIAHADTVL